MASSTSPSASFRGGARPVHPIFSPDKSSLSSQSFLDKTIERIDEDTQEIAGKTNHYAGLCFGMALVFMGLSFYDGYRLLGERTFSLLLRSTLWAVAATIIGTAGEILQKTTRVETPIGPSIVQGAITPRTLKEGQFPGMPNMGNTCFINAPTQAIMNDTVYPAVYKEICEGAKARHISFKNFLELYPSQNGILSSLGWPKILSRKREDEPLLTVVNMRDVLVMLMMRRSSLKYNSESFKTHYPHIHRLIGEFSKVKKDVNFPPVDDNDHDLRQEFTKMINSPTILQFFDQERPRIVNEILGFDAYLKLIQAYEYAVAQNSTTVSFGRWSSIGNITHLIPKAGVDSQQDVEEFLHCISKYVFPGDYPQIYFPLAYERTWEECPENEQDPIKLSELLASHQNPRNANDTLMQIPDGKKSLGKASPVGILEIKALLREEVNGQELLDETFSPQKQINFCIDGAGRVRKYRLIEKIIPPSAEKMPERIILELVRYKWNDNGKREKIKCEVNFPERIKICDQGYRLKSIVRHSGTPEKGHYDTLVYKEGQWWYASDTTVDIALPADLAQADKDGYLYFYEKI